VRVVGGVTIERVAGSWCRSQRVDVALDDEDLFLP
jgi:hypothetical protein